MKLNEIQRALNSAKVDLVDNAPKKAALDQVKGTE